MRQTRHRHTTWDSTSTKRKLASPSQCREGRRSGVARMGGAAATGDRAAGEGARVPRFLQHVLPRGFVRVRHFGFLSAAAKGRLARVPALLGAPTGVVGHRAPHASAHAMNHGFPPAERSASAQSRRLTPRDHAPPCLRPSEMRPRPAAKTPPAVKTALARTPRPSIHRQPSVPRLRIDPRHPSAPRSVRNHAPGPPESFAHGPAPTGAH